MEEVILRDIERINKSLYSVLAEDLQRELIAKYRGEINHIEHDLDYGDFDENDKPIPPDYSSNLINIKAKLEVLLAKIRDEKAKPKEQPVSPVSVVTTNNNTSSSNNQSTNTFSNNNTIDVKVLFEDARRKIEDNDSLTDTEIEEIIQRISELEELHSSDENKRSKWTKSKEILKWVIDKGATVASEVLPLITEIIG